MLIRVGLASLIRHGVKPYMGRGLQCGVRERVFRRSTSLLTVPPQQRSPGTRAALSGSEIMESPDIIRDSLQIGIVVSIVLSTGLSLLPILTGESKERHEEKLLGPDMLEDGDEVKWSVMTVLSFLPFLNPMAWIFAALDDETSPTIYWSFAVLYSLPYLKNGFELDGFTTLVLMLGIVHIQVERIAQTEPVEIELSDWLRKALRRLPGTVDRVGRVGSTLGEEMGTRVRRSLEAQERRPDRKYLEEKSREARAELDDFDRRQRLRMKERQSDSSYEDL